MIQSQAVETLSPGDSVSRHFPHSPVTLLQVRCLRKRLSGFSCQQCLDLCPRHALSDNDGEIVLDHAECNGCGLCTSRCPGDALAFPSFHCLNALTAAAGNEDITLVCSQDRPEVTGKVVEIPCVGVLSAEALVFLGLAYRGTVRIHLGSCAGCSRQVVAARFAALFRGVMGGLGHLFHSSLQLHHKEQLTPDGRGSRRLFLADLGRAVAAVVREEIGGLGLPQESVGKRRRLTSNAEFILRAIQAAEPERQRQLIDWGTPELTVGQTCQPCPRCKGMCPSGALEVVKNGDHKSLVFYRQLCSACGLCAAFCPKDAITVQESRLHTELKAQALTTEWGSGHNEG